MFFLFEQRIKGRFVGSFLLSGISMKDVNTIMSLMVGETKVYQGEFDDSMPLEDRPEELNTQVFGTGIRLGSMYKRCSFRLADMKDDKTLNDLRSIMKQGLLTAGFDRDTPANYLNLIVDKKES